MKNNRYSIFVEDQDKALSFYTEKLGFVKKHDVPVGEFKWLTVVSPEQPDGTEVLLEPNKNHVAEAYQKGFLNKVFLLGLNPFWIQK